MSVPAPVLLERSRKRPTKYGVQSTVVLLGWFTATGENSCWGGKCVSSTPGLQMFFVVLPEIYLNSKEYSSLQNSMVQQSALGLVSIEISDSKNMWKGVLRRSVYEDGVWSTEYKSIRLFAE